MHNAREFCSFIGQMYQAVCAPVAILRLPRQENAASTAIIYMCIHSPYYSKFNRHLNNISSLAHTWAPSGHIHAKKRDYARVGAERRGLGRLAVQAAFYLFIILFYHK